MPKLNINPFQERVFALSDEDFELLDQAVQMRRDKETYGVTSFEDLAVKEGRKPICPECGSEDVILDAHTPDGKQRYKCKNCSNVFTLLTNSIFHSTNKSLHTWALYLVLMTYNVPLEMTEELCGIAHNTAMLWRQKVFSTVDGYQDHLYLYGRVWIDETYIYDSTILHDDNYQKKRGLSKDLLCIVVAIDNHKNVYVKIIGHGKPSGPRVYNALKDHIREGSTIVHDGEKAHNMLIKKNNCKSEVYIADTKSQEYLENMALVNNLCSWIKRFIYRFIGMRKDNLQSYLNWFVYLFRVKAASERWPKIPRILRHLVLSQLQYKRKKA